MNIYQKLIEVRKTCEYIKKDKDGYKFKYVSSDQALGAVRKKMDELGLLLIPSVTETNVSDHTTRKGDHEYFTEIKIRFTWLNADNPEEHLECDWYGQGLDNGEKGVGKALTYAEKYFLLKFFNISTPKDDPDYLANQRQPASQPRQPQRQPQQQPAKQQLPGDKYQEMLKNFASWKAYLKKLTGSDETYYNILGSEGYEKANQILGTDAVQKGNKILKLMSDQAAEIKKGA